MTKNSEYWERRIASETWKIYNSIEEKNRELLNFYIGASESLKDELYRLAEKYSKDGVLSRSEMHKKNRLTELNKKFEKIIEDLGHDAESLAKKNMFRGFKEVYKTVAVGMGDVDFAMPNKKLMEKLMDTPWRGDTFSRRLWKNQKKLANVLNDILLVGLQQGKTVTEIAIQLHNRMGQGFNECHRLIRTETMHYLNDATLQRYKDAGVETVQIWAALDERTCDTCGGYHSKKYPINKCPHVPLHANCRCTVLPVVELNEKDSAETIAKESDFGIIKMYRKGNTHRKTSLFGHKIIDKATYHKITRSAIKNGADIRFADEEWTRHLEEQNATAVTIGDVIFFREDVTVSDVLEETYHFMQNKNGLNVEFRERERIILNEIDAKKYVLSMSEKYHVPAEEIELTKKQLKSYQKEMDDLIERGEWNA